MVDGEGGQKISKGKKLVQKTSAAGSEITLRRTRRFEKTRLNGGEFALPGGGRAGEKWPREPRVKKRLIATERGRRKFQKKKRRIPKKRGREVL